MSSPAPELSVIVATHDRRGLLLRCLGSLAEQSADPASFEVIVADDGSEDGSAEAARELRTPYALRVMALPKQGHAITQNTAMAEARGGACLLLDDDVIASPDLIAAHIEAHRADPMTLGIGSLTQQRIEADDWYAHAFAHGAEEHYRDLETREASWTDCYGANVSFPRQTMLELGGVSTDLPAAKDFDLGYRLYSAGCKPRYLPRAHGVHDDQKGYRRMLADVQRQGTMHVELARRHPDAATTLLDWENSGGPRELSLRRLAIWLRLPPGALVRLGRLLPGEGRKMIWLHFIRRLAFWRGVRGSLTQHSWVLVTHGQVLEAIAENLP